MGFIKTTSTKDVFGTGNAKSASINGKNYTIRTTSTKDVFGDGNIKEIIETGSEADMTSFWGVIIVAMFLPLFGAFGLGFCWLITKLFCA